MAHVCIRPACGAGCRGCSGAISALQLAALRRAAISGRVQAQAGPGYGDAMDALHRLGQQGYLEQTDDAWRLTPSGEALHAKLAEEREQRS